MSQPVPDIIQSAAKFLQTPTKPERRLEEKIRFLIHEKKLTQYQLIAALKQANLYSIETIEPILTMCYFEQNQKKKSKRKKSKHSSHPQAPSSGAPPLPAQPHPSTYSPWWSTLSQIGIGVASFIASYTVSTTASQNLVKRSEEKTTAKLDTVKTEIKEQADLDRERQHRDLMEVVNLLKTQVQCVQQNLGVLKQSIDVIQTQMKHNSMGNNVGDMAHASSVINRNMITRASGDDGSIISSAISIPEDTKPKLGVIGTLLTQNDDGLDWLNTDIVTSDQEEKEKKEAITDADSIPTDEITERKDDKVVSVTEAEESEDVEEDSEIIYHPDYKDMISTLPTDIIEIKQQLTDLLRMWQRMVLNKEDALTVEKIKAGFNALNFYINKILRKPFLESTRKINTYNKQYKERLSTLPRIETLLTLIGYEKDNVFWTLPLLCEEDTTDEKSKHVHDRQIEFLKAFKEVLSNLFNMDGALPFALSESIMNIKQERDDQKKENEKENEKENPKEKEKGVEFDKAEEEDTSSAPSTQYSNKFMEVAKLVAQGKKPDDVKEIDDMPPDPNAEPSESKMVQPPKPFQMDSSANVDENRNNDDDNDGLSWFEKYEAEQNKSAIETSAGNEDNVDNVDVMDSNPKDIVETDINALENQQNEE